MQQHDCHAGLKLPVQGTNLAPFAQVWIEGTDFNITVGNQSDPEHGNAAVICSFQTGEGEGAGTTIEIHDEQGGNFEAFMRRLNKSFEKATSDYRMKVQWGWINTDCGDTGGGIVKLSPVCWFLPKLCEASYTEGKIKFKLTGSSLLEIVFQGRRSTIYPKLRLKQAIRQMFKDGPPEINKVDFFRISADGKTEEEWPFDAKDGGTDGPLGPYACEMDATLYIRSR